MLGDLEFSNIEQNFNLVQNFGEYFKIRACPGHVSEPCFYKELHNLSIRRCTYFEKDMFFPDARKKGRNLGKFTREIHSVVCFLVERELAKDTSNF